MDIQEGLGDFKNLAGLPDDGKNVFQKQFPMIDINNSWWILLLLLVLYSIFSWLTPKDIGSLSQTCRRFNKTIKENEDRLWARVCQNHLNIRIPSVNGFARRFYKNGNRIIFGLFIQVILYYISWCNYYPIFFNNDKCCAFMAISLDYGSEKMKWHTMMDCFTSWYVTNSSAFLYFPPFNIIIIIFQYRDCQLIGYDLQVLVPSSNRSESLHPKSLFRIYMDQENNDEAVIQCCLSPATSQFKMDLQYIFNQV